MKLELCGYFDCNFGDDYMQKITVRHMPEFEFCIDSSDGSPSPIVLAEKNVKEKTADETAKIPKLLVTGSGFMVNSREALLCEIVWFLRAKHIADYCIGCNIEPFPGKFAEWLVSKKLGKFKTVICRDKASLLWLQKHCPKTESVYMPDILFAMPRSGFPSKTDGENLGISLIQYDGYYYEAMAKIADFWIKATGKGVILMAFNTGSENDVLACEKVKKLMKSKYKTKIVKHGVCGEILKAYSECRKIIGARFHSAVLSLKCEIDFYPIYHRIKMRNLMSDLNYPIKGNDISSVDIDKIENFLRLESTGFKLDKKIEAKTMESFEILKEQIRKKER